MSVGVKARSKTLSLVEFLRRPETEPASEYIEGRVVPRMSPKLRHSWLQGDFAHAINQFARARMLGRAMPELRSTFAGRSLVFDVSFFRRDRIPIGPEGEPIDDVFLAPDLAIEILSPGQSVPAAEKRLLWAVKNGVRLAWLVDPKRRYVKVFRPSTRPLRLNGDDLLDGADVLPGFHLKVREVFDWLRQF